MLVIDTEEAGPRIILTALADRAVEVRRSARDRLIVLLMLDFWCKLLRIIDRMVLHRLNHLHPEPDR
jgi:hypothetical protein